MKTALILIMLAAPLSAVAPPSLAGSVAVLVAVADHPHMIMHGLRATGRAIAKPFRRRKAPILKP